MDSSVTGPVDSPVPPNAVVVINFLVGLPIFFYIIEKNIVSVNVVTN
jgi:hypothetical protein